MKAQRLTIVLTMTNITLLLFTILQTRPTTAQTVPPILRTNTLESVSYTHLTLPTICSV